MFEIELNAEDQKVLEAAAKAYESDRTSPLNPVTCGKRQLKDFTDLYLVYDVQRLVDAGLLDMLDQITFKEYYITDSGLSTVKALTQPPAPARPVSSVEVIATLRAQLAEANNRVGIFKALAESAVDQIKGRVQQLAEANAENNYLRETLAGSSEMRQKAEADAAAMRAILQEAETELVEMCNAREFDARDNFTLQHIEQVLETSNVGAGLLKRQHDMKRALVYILDIYTTPGYGFGYKENIVPALVKEGLGFDMPYMPVSREKVEAMMMEEFGKPPPSPPANFDECDLEFDHAKPFTPDAPPKPKIVCLCGSTRFSEAFHKANLTETLAGNIVLTIGCDMRSDAALFDGFPPERLAQIKADLDKLHLRKIDLADEVVILNVGGYVGESTKRELIYAATKGKAIRWLELDKTWPGYVLPVAGPKDNSQ